VQITTTISVLRWMTLTLVFLTQPPYPQRDGKTIYKRSVATDAPRQGLKAYGSFHLWIKVKVAGKTVWSLVNTCHTWAVSLRSWVPQNKRYTSRLPLLPAAVRAVQSAGISYSEACIYNFEFFDPQRRHVAPTEWNLAWRSGPIFDLLDPCAVRN